MLMYILNVGKVKKLTSKPPNEKLQELYEDKKLSTRKIGLMFGVSKLAVSNWLKKIGIKPRKKGFQPEHPGFIEKSIPPRGIKTLYKRKKLTHRQIAKIFGVSKAQVTIWLRELGVHPNKYPGGRGPKATAWKGPVKTTQEGRVLLYRPQHPRAYRSGYVKRSILVWERYHKRPVPAGYDIHHKNENPSDDTPTNLQAMTHSNHGKHHRFWEKKRRKTQ